MCSRIRRCLQTRPGHDRIPYLGYRYHHFGVTQEFQEGASAPSHPPLRVGTASFTARAENNQKPVEIFRSVAQKTGGKVLFPCDRTHAADWTSAGKTGIASPTGHRRSKKHRKEVARRKDSRSAAPIRTQIGTSVPLAQAARKSGLCFRIEFEVCSGRQTAAPRGPSRTSEGDGAQGRRTPKSSVPQISASPPAAGTRDSRGRGSGRSLRHPYRQSEPWLERSRLKPQPLASCERSITSSKTQTTPCKARGRPVYIKQQLDAFITCHQATIPRGYPLRGTRLS